MSSNPRRTAVTPLPLKTNMVLRKGATFHSPTSPSSSPSQDTTGFRPPRLPKRSQTNLDDVVDASRRRAALTLGNFEQIYNSPSPESSSSLPTKSFRDNSLPIPRGILNHNIDSSIMSKATGFDRRILRPRPRRSAQHHDSDSGLGTSIATTPEQRTKPSSSQKEKAPVKASAITRSGADSSSAKNLPPLSAKATNRIYEHTLKPLLAKRAFKDFHALLLEVPNKIQEKKIICLRDVEKTLLFAAPVSELLADQGIKGDTYRALCLKERTKSTQLCVDFSLTTVRCIQATVEYLNEQEQTRPRDLPYTSGYFIDLVDQIMQYGQQLADAREKGKDNMDIDQYATRPREASLRENHANSIRSTDSVKLHGGIHINGRPAELVRVRKDGQAVSLATGEPIESVEEESKGALRIKRSASQELEDEEEIMRSMARRKKNATPEELAPKRCAEPGCNKQFNRSCDLTKHEKTHSRPWKCPVTTCKYHKYGWPTEKEMDRHHNDKHSANPAMYACDFPNCAYKSKRDSNKKQHMEKAHGWVYKRTKTNLKKQSAASVQGSNTEPTPQLQNIPTPASEHSMGVATPPDDHFNLFNNTNIDFPTYIPHDAGFDLIPQDLKLDYSPADNGTPTTDPGLDYSSTFPDIGNDFTLYEDIYSATARIPTPAHDVYQKEFPQQQFAPLVATDFCQPQPDTHISPIGHGNAMLFTPNSLAEVEDCFDTCDDFGGAGKTFNEDFVLFPAANAAAKSMFNDVPFLGEMPSLAGGYSQPNSQDIIGNMMMDWAASGEFKHYA